MIIVYGGTFNPPTIAHQKIAKQIIEKFKPSKFILLPVGDYYPWKDSFASFYHRKEMLKLTFPQPIFEISEIENEKAYQGTYKALKQIESQFKEEVRFLLGADNLDYLDQWLNYQSLIKEYKFIVLTRKGFDVENIIDDKFANYKANFSIHNFNLDIAAANFRNDPTKIDIVVKPVYSYLKKHNLYGVK
ncbi:MAG: nicotinate-nicotinamide nucleotide adenylyltransferase [Acholeplasmataceae bacterium]|jgi:nicotinate-nucleotide adenylyltransferase|nr:nicotinate-nicotinamide nucleotide adenylyltransferase [Acholeplasmataceae bacterium]